jgi:hypothetical protein
LQPETALDDLEQTTHDVGNAVLRRVLQAQWDTIDAQLAADYRRRFSPSGADRRRSRARHCR